MSSLLEEALLLHKKGQLKEAENLYKSILDSSSSNFEVIHLLGIIKIQLKQFEEAIVWLNKATSVNPNNHSVFNNLGVCYKELKKYNEALNNFKIALNIKPDYAEVYNNIAIIYKSLINYNKAIENYNKAIKLKPDYAEAYNNLGIVYLDQEKFEEAKDALNKAIKLKPDYAEAYNNLGNVYKNLKQYEQSIEYFNITLKLKKNYHEAYSNLALVYMRQEKFDEAKDALKKAIKLKPDYTSAYNNLGIVYLDQEKFEEAKDALKKAIKLKPDFAEAYNNLGIVYLNQEKFDQAKDVLNKAIKLKPNFAEAYNSLGTLNFQLKEFNEALINTNKAINLKSNYAEAYNNLGLIYFALKEHEKGKSYIDQALRLDSNLAKIYSSLATYYEFIENYEKTEINLKKALQLSKKKINPALALAGFYHNLKNFSKAEEVYNVILQNESDNADAYFCRGILYETMGRYDLSIPDLKKALKINPKIEEQQNEMFYLLNFQNRICEWKDYNKITNKIFNDLKNNKIKDSHSYIFLNISDSGELIKKTALAKVEILLKERKIFNINTIKNKKIHIGYYSPDFKDHPVGYIMSELLDFHNKEIFEITAFSLNPYPDKKPEIKNKIINSVNAFLDCSKKSYIDIIKESRKRKIDLAIDLAGFTSDNKIKIFANRAAPVQVNFLGYPCTLGINHDYIIGDLELIPKEKINLYFEKIIYMPDTYLPSYTRFNLNSKKEVDFDFKKFNFIFANFNNHTKITPIVFNSWINILKKVENSALILNEGINKYSEENLIKEAIKRNFDPKRIIFSKRVDYNDHNIKYKYCDLFLDTFPYNAHSTATTCLLSGVPLLTIKGDYFQSRVSSSLLKCLKMDELISLNIEEYENKAINIGNCNKELQRIKDKLKSSLINSKIFNTKNYTENLEKAYNKIYERYHKKLEPENIFIK